MRGLIGALGVVALLAGAVGAVRWARRGGTAAILAASALLLTFGIGLVATHPQRTTQSVAEQCVRRAGENGDPPWLTQLDRMIAADYASRPGSALGPSSRPRRWRAQILAAMRGFKRRPRGDR